MVPNNTYNIEYEKIKKLFTQHASTMFSKSLFYIM